MPSFLSVLVSRHGEHLVDWAGLVFLLGVWAAGLLYADFSGVADLVLAAVQRLS